MMTNYQLDLIQTAWKHKTYCTLGIKSVNANSRPENRVELTDTFKFSPPYTPTYSPSNSFIICMANHTPRLPFISPTIMPVAYHRPQTMPSVSSVNDPE